MASLVLLASRDKRRFVSYINKVQLLAHPHIMKILSLFDGISIAQQAIKELGFEVEYYASEIDKQAISITQKNHPNTEQLGDIKDIDCTNGLLHYGKGKLAKTHIYFLIGGSPCQDLSIAKKNREGLNGKRSGLFWEYVRILKELKPRYFILENVASMPKEAKNIITETLWGIEPIMIDASLLSAQQRKRLFWIGKLTDKGHIVMVENWEYEKVDILQPENKEIYLKDILESGEAVKEKAYCLTAHQKDFINDFIKRHQENYVFKDKPIRLGSLGKGGQGDRIYSIHGKSVCLSANGGGRGAKTGLYLITGGAKRTREGKGKTLEIRKDGKSNSLTTVSTDSLVVLKDYFRPLTPIECERLQSLTEIEQSCIIKVCIDHQNNYVNAVTKNLKLQSVVGNVEKSESNENVLSAEKSLNINNLQTNKPAPQDVLISCEENKIEIYNQEKLLLSASGAKKQNLFRHLKLIDDFVRLIVGLNTIVEKTMPFGEAELPQKSNLLVVKESGNNVVNIYGKGITQLAEDAEKDLTTLNKLLKSTISDLSIQGSNEQIIQTLFSYVVNAILGYIPKEIQNQNILTFQIKSKIGYTYGISNTQRYKTLGNGFNCAVIKHIIKSIL